MGIAQTSSTRNRSLKFKINWASKGAKMLWYKIENEEKKISGVVQYTVESGQFKEHQLAGNIKLRNKPFTSSMANGDLEDTVESLLEKSFPYHKGWEYNRIEYCDLEDELEDMVVE